MRYTKPKGVSDPISRLRREEGWNKDKRYESLAKNRAFLDYGSVSRIGIAATVLKTEGSEMGV